MTEEENVRQRPSFLRGVTIGICLLLVVMSVVATFIVYPHLKDDWRLDGIVQAVALDWRDFGEKKARARLEYELDHQEIGLAVSDESCILDGAEGSERTVECSWEVSFRIPFSQELLVLPFGSKARITADGQLQ